MSANAPKQMVEDLIGKYRRGKNVGDFKQSSSSMADAMSLKYKNFLSRRKFNLLCKTQSSVFDTENEVWVPRKCQVFGF